MINFREKYNEEVYILCENIVEREKFIREICEEIIRFWESEVEKVVNEEREKFNVRLDGFFD